MTNGLTAQQVEFLLRPLHPTRLVRDNNGMSHVSQQDVRAHLTRIFGFGGWSTRVLDLSLVETIPTKTKAGKDAWLITYRACVQLTVKNPAGDVIASYEDVGTGTSPSLPSKGDAHDFACKVAVSIALKRAATNLGDGFGLSLYNKGQMKPLVMDTLVKPDGDGTVPEQVEQQESLGNDDAGSVEHHDEPAQRVKGDAAETTEWNLNDPAWIKAWEGQVGRCESTEDWQKAWHDLGAQYKTGALSEEQLADLKQLWTDAMREQQESNRLREAHEQDNYDQAKAEAS